MPADKHRRRYDSSASETSERHKKTTASKSKGGTKSSSKSAEERSESKSKPKDRTFVVMDSPRKGGNSDEFATGDALFNGFIIVVIILAIIILATAVGMGSFYVIKEELNSDPAQIYIITHINYLVFGKNISESIFPESADSVDTIPGM